MRRCKPIKDRFLSKVQIGQDDACWIWTACKDPNGYGQISVPGQKAKGAHRVSYELFIGQIPDGYVIDHLCRNHSCVNPKHLEAVTMAENTRRGILHPILRAKSLQQTHCKRGHPLFGPNVRTDEQGHRMCIACQREAARLWKIANRDRVNAQQQRRRALAKGAIA